MSDFNDALRIALMLEAGHQAIHDMDEPGPDTETMLVALSERELLVIGLALPIMELQFPCLHDASQALQHRLMELVRVQNPGWTASGREESDNPPTEGRSE